MRARAGLIIIAVLFAVAAVLGWIALRPTAPGDAPAPAAASTLRDRAPKPERPESAAPPEGASPEELLEHRRHSIEGVGISQVEMEQLLALLSESETQVTPLGVACGPAPCVLAFSHDPNNTTIVGDVRALAEEFGGPDTQAELSWEDSSSTGYLWFSPRHADEAELEALRMNAEAHRAALAPR